MAASRTRLWFGLAFAATVCLASVVKTADDLVPAAEPGPGLLSNSHVEQLREIHGLPSHLGSVNFWHLMSDTYQ
jgi:hypothetical protein